MSKANTMRGFVIIQVMQDAQPYDNICVSEARVLPKRLGIADHESPPASVRPFGRIDTSCVDVEAEVIDAWKPM